MLIMRDAFLIRRHHRQRRAPRRIDYNPDTAANLDVWSFYRKEFKAVLDTQISTFTDVLENCVATIKPLMSLFDALQPGKEPPLLQTYEALPNFHPENGRPDPNALMSEVETFTLHTKADVKDIFGAAKKAEEMKSVFPLAQQSLSPCINCFSYSCQGRENF